MEKSDSNSDVNKMSSSKLPPSDDNSPLHGNLSDDVLSDIKSDISNDSAMIDDVSKKGSRALLYLGVATIAVVGVIILLVLLFFTSFDNNGIELIDLPGSVFIGEKFNVSVDYILQEDVDSAVLTFNFNDRVLRFDDDVSEGMNTFVAPISFNEIGDHEVVVELKANGEVVDTQTAFVSVNLFEVDNIDHNERLVPGENFVYSFDVGVDEALDVPLYLSLTPNVGDKSITRKLSIDDSFKVREVFNAELFDEGVNSVELELFYDPVFGDERVVFDKRSFQLERFIPDIDFELVVDQLSGWYHDYVPRYTQKVFQYASYDYVITNKGKTEVKNLNYRIYLPGFTFVDNTIDLKAGESKSLSQDEIKLVSPVFDGNLPSPIKGANLRNRNVITIARNFYDASRGSYVIEEQSYKVVGDELVYAVTDEDNRLLSGYTISNYPTSNGGDSRKYFLRMDVSVPGFDDFEEEAVDMILEIPHR